MLSVLGAMGVLVVTAGQVQVQVLEPVQAVPVWADVTVGVTRDADSPFPFEVKDGELTVFWSDTPVGPGTYDLATVDGCPTLVSQGFDVDQQCAAVGVEPGTWGNVKGLYR